MVNSHCDQCIAYTVGTPTPPLVATLPSEGSTLVIIIALVLCSVGTFTTSHVC